MSLDVYADELSCSSYICFKRFGFILGMLEGVLKSLTYTPLHHVFLPALLSIYSILCIWNSVCWSVIYVYIDSFELLETLFKKQAFANENAMYTIVVCSVTWEIFYYEHGMYSGLITEWIIIVLGLLLRRIPQVDSLIQFGILDSDSSLDPIHLEVRTHLYQTY